MPTKLYDVLIIGGGPAGLSLATTLSRQLYSALVIDSGTYRNAQATHMHTVPGFDHVPPSEFRAKVRGDLQERYPSIEFQSTTIKEVRRTDTGVFEAIDENGVVFRGRKLGLATGVRDMVEKEAEGYAECWGRGINAVSIAYFCHGYEERGAESVGVVATGLITTQELVGHVSPMAARLSMGVTVYTNGNLELSAGLRDALKNSSKFCFEDRKICRYQLQNGGPAVKITLEDGTVQTQGFIVSHPNVEQRAPFSAQLGLDRIPSGEIKVSPPFNETSLRGCFAVGDLGSPMKSAVQAVHMGSFAAVGMTAQLQKELLDSGDL